MNTQSAIFLRFRNRTIRHVERHQDILSDYWYLDTQSGREFDVRELPATHIGTLRQDVLRGERDAHRQVIKHAISAGFEFSKPASM